MSLHPVVARGADGKLPPWSVAGPARVAHMSRVADLLAGWAMASGASGDEMIRWRAAGFLHDALRDAEPQAIRPWLPSDLADLPPQVTHGPAAAERLRADGVSDEPFLRAIAYHTIGHPELDRLGRAVYAADFLEPGRKHLAEERAALRARMPGEVQAVVREIAKLRIARQLDEEVPLRPETCQFWNVLVQEAHA